MNDVEDGLLESEEQFFHAFLSLQLDAVVVYLPCSVPRNWLPSCFYCHVYRLSEAITEAGPPAHTS